MTLISPASSGKRVAAQGALVEQRNAFNAQRAALGMAISGTRLLALVPLAIGSF